MTILPIKDCRNIQVVHVRTHYLVHFLVIGLLCAFIFSTFSSASEDLNSGSNKNCGGEERKKFSFPSLPRRRDRGDIVNGRKEGKGEQQEGAATRNGNMY